MSNTINTLNIKNNYLKKDSIIKRMKRLFQIRWLLKNLKADCGGHISVQDLQAIKNRLLLGVDRGAYLDTLSNLPKNKRLNSRELALKLENYQNIIDTCIEQGLIQVIETPNKLSGVAIKTSYKADEWLSKFWYKNFIDNPIATALIIGAIGWIFTNFVLKPAITEIKLTTPQNITTPINVYPVNNIYPNATTTK